MTKTVSYTEARANFAKLWDEAESTSDPIRITRRGKADMAMLPADELSSLLETAYLLRSPANARRLLGALERARAGETEPTTVAQIRAEHGLEDDE